MRNDIIDFLQKEVKKRCASPNNKFGYGAYYHFQSVVKNAIFLSEIYNADLEIVTIAAWLHDIASITDISLYEEHHIHGSKIAEEILSDFEYESQKIKKVQLCILHHRGSRLYEKESAEEKCIADADAIAHFDELPSLFYLMYVQKNYNF